MSACWNVFLSKFAKNALTAGREVDGTLLFRRHFLRLRNAALFSSKSADSAENTNNAQAERDPLSVFCSDKVQNILKRITGFDLHKINRPHKTATAPPHYDLLTDDQLKQKQAEAEAVARERLQMPPYMKPREPITEVLSHDPEIGGLFESKFVFIDITYGLPDRRRHIVVREEDGTLRQASWEERDKVVQIFNPIEGRSVFTPKMFSPENLEMLMSKRRYEFILDRACVQFEPDNPEFIRVSHRTYEAVNSQHDFEALRSTRHFGPMAFYLSWHRQIDHLLIDMLKRDKMLDAVDLVQLYHTLHPDCKSAVESKGVTVPYDGLHLLEMFAQHDSVERGQVELALQAYHSTQRGASVS